MMKNKRATSIVPRVNNHRQPRFEYTPVKHGASRAAETVKVTLAIVLSSLVRLVG